MHGEEQGATRSPGRATVRESPSPAHTPKGTASLLPEGPARGGPPTRSREHARVLPSLAMAGGVCRVDERDGGRRTGRGNKAGAALDGRRSRGWARCPAGGTGARPGVRGWPRAGAGTDGADRPRPRTTGPYPYLVPHHRGCTGRDPPLPPCAGGVRARGVFGGVLFTAVVLACGVRAAGGAGGAPELDAVRAERNVTGRQDERASAHPARCGARTPQYAPAPDRPRGARWEHRAPGGAHPAGVMCPAHAPVAFQPTYRSTG